MTNTTYNNKCNYISKSKIKGSISRIALSATLGALATSAFATPAVFFNGDVAAGIQTFTNVIGAADTAYNTANPGATQQSNIFAIDLNNSTTGSFSVSSNGQTVYVVTTLAGTIAPNNANGDENSLGFTEWDVDYTRGDFNDTIAKGYTVSFYSDAGHTTPFSVNAAGLLVSDWGTCCTTNNTTPNNGTANASEIYMMFNGATPLRVGGISTTVGREEHFVAAIDDSNSFSSVTLIPNGHGEAFGAGGYLIFSNVQVGSVPAGSSEVTVGTPNTPDIDDEYTFTDLQNSDVNPVFDGGTLTATGDVTVSNGITIKNSGGTIDTAGHDTVMTGALNNATGATGSITKTGAGTLTLAGNNGYTGTTTISDGTLALSGAGSIANSSGLVNNGTFDIADTTNGTALKNLSGNGAVNLGAQSLAITDGDGAFDGSINGTGGVVVAGANGGQGTMTLSGANGYTGTTTITDGTLALTGTGSIANSSELVANGTFDISDTTGGATLRNLSGNGAVNLGAQTLAITDGDGTFNGAINGTGNLVVDSANAGQGTMTLAGNNGYTGTTTISDGTLALSGAGSIANSAELVNNGIFDISATTDGAAVKNLSGNGAVNLGGQTLMITNGDGGFDGPINGTGGVVLAGGTYTLSGENSQSMTGVTGGRLTVASAQALGASNGDLYIGADSSFAAGSSMTVSQAVHIGGANAVFDTGANNVTLTGGADGYECLIKEGTGRMTLASAASNMIGACVRNGTLSFNNVFTGNVWVDPSGTGSGAGAINGNVEVRGRLAPGNSPGQLTVNGSVTQFAGSTLSVDIDGTTAGTGAGHFDTLVLVGANSVYTADGTIEPVLRGITGSATNSFNPQIGAQFQVVTAQGGVVGTYDAITQPAVGLPTNSRFDVLYKSNAIILYITPSDFSAMFSNSTLLNAAAAGGAIDSFRTASGTVNSGPSGALLDGLYPLGQAGLNRALEQASGAIYANTMDSVIQATRFAHGAVSDHLNAGVDGLDIDAPLASRVWGIMSRDITHVDGDVRGQGYRGNNVTMVIGVDRAVGSNALIGGAFAYNRNKTSTAFAGNSSADSYHGIVYGRLNASNWYANGLVSFGMDLYNATRTVDLATGPQTAHGEGDGVSFGADAEAGFKLRFGGLLMTPAVGISYDGLRRDGFAETGDQTVALTLDKDFRRSVVARAGARVTTAIATQGVVLMPYASAFAARELNDASSLITPTLHGARFRVEAPEMDRTSVRLNAGVNAALTSGVTLKVDYRHSNAGNFSANAVTGGVSIRW